MSGSLPQRGESISLRMHPTSIRAQSSFMGQTSFKDPVNSFGEKKNELHYTENTENGQEKITVTENLELQINIEQNTRANGKSKVNKNKIAKIKNKILRGSPYKLEEKTIIGNKENVSIVETVLIKNNSDEKDDANFQVTS